MDFDKIVEKFSEGSRKAFLDAREKVSNLEDFEEVPLEFQKEVALVCLMFVEETPLTEKDILETCFVLTNSFVWNNYNKPLSKAIDLIGELETPVHFDSGEGFRFWEKVKDYLITYLDGEEKSNHS